MIIKINIFNKIIIIIMIVMIILLSSLLNKCGLIIKKITKKNYDEIKLLFNKMNIDDTKIQKPKRIRNKKYEPCVILIDPSIYEIITKLNLK